MKHTYEGIEYDIDEAYSFKDMTGWDLSDHKDMDGKVIYCLTLSNETPDAQVLPANLTGATFIKCNLCNVFVPPGNTVIDCQTQRFKVQNDGEDWFIGDDDKPVEPIAKKLFEQLGLSTDPKDIPDVKLEKAATLDPETAKAVLADSIAVEPVVEIP